LIAPIVQRREIAGKDFFRLSLTGGHGFAWRHQVIGFGAKRRYKGPFVPNRHNEVLTKIAGSLQILD